jgi:hypothetical protein
MSGKRLTHVNSKIDWNALEKEAKRLAASGTNWQVWQGGALVIDNLTEAQARNKVENEARFGTVMEVRNKIFEVEEDF